MLFLFQLKHDIWLYHIKHLFTLSFKFNNISSGHASFYVNLELLSFLCQSLTLAVYAVFLIDFSFALASITGLLHLHLHEAHLDHLNSHTLAIAFITYFLFAALRSWTFALTAVYVSIDGINWAVSKVKLFQRHFYRKFVHWTLLSLVATSKNDD